MISRRSFLRILGIGAIAGPTLVRVALATPVPPAPTGLTLEKLIAAKKLMDANDCLGAEFYNVRFRQIMSEAKHPLASGEIQDFMGFKFVRTELFAPKPLSAAEIRQDIAFGRTLDQRISARWHMIPTYAPRSFTWKKDTVLMAVDADLDRLLVNVPQVRESAFAAARAALRRAWSNA